MENPKSQESALKYALEHVNFISAKLPEIIGICLGGSYAQPNNQPDNITDLDLFCYLDVEELPNAQELEQRLEKPQITQLRRRATLIEYRINLGPFDSNVKYFTRSFMLQQINRPVSLDEVYLEEIESYQHFKVLFDREGKMSALLNKARNDHDTKIEEFKYVTLEAYGKVVGAAVRQGILRSTQVTVAQMNIMKAVHNLLIMLYLMDNTYPAPFKWRASPRYLAKVQKGEAFHDILSIWLNSPNPFNLDNAFRALYNLERLVAGDFTKSPWNLHTDDSWWWIGQKLDEEDYDGRGR